MFRRFTYGLLASGGVLFLAGASGLTPAWFVASGALILTAASVLAAVGLEDRDLRPRPPEGLARVVEPRVEISHAELAA